jgi:hypothetical protein
MALAPPATALRSPVALLIFNRADLTAQLFAAIRAARPQRLLVVADGPRNPAEAARCQAARDVIQVDWDCQLSTHYSDVNLGCKGRISSGIDWIFSEVEEAIILEDDTLPSPTFFGFCQALLERYRDDERVMNIGGTNLYPHPLPANRPESYYFARYGHTGGWASWRRAWTQHYDVTMAAWPEFKRAGRIKDLFESRAEQLYWTMLFDAQYENRMDTWDYQWLFARLLQGGLTATASVNMVANLGFRADATHSVAMPKSWYPARRSHDLHELVHPPALLPYREADRHQFEEIFNPRGAAGLALFGLRRLAQTLGG